MEWELDEMKAKSKESFKKLVKKQARNVTLTKLKKQQNKHTKMANLNYQELEIQTYFIMEGLNI